MQNYGHYVHKKALCHALPNTLENQPVIINTLMADAEAGLLDTLTLDTVTGSNQIVLTFKYRTDTTQQTLNPEDYLVCYLDGSKTTLSPETFLGTYEEYEGAFANCAITDKTQLSI